MDAKTRVACGLSLVAVLAVLGLPTGAEAKSGYKVRPASLELDLPVAKIGGHHISVIADGRQRVRFATEWPTPPIEYSTKGHVTGRRITADFGALGRIDVSLRFVHPKSAPAHNGSCRGRGSRYGEGTYRGTIEFSRQAGVPEVSAKRGRAIFQRRFRRVCKRRHPRPKPSLFPKLTRQTEEGLLAVSGKSDGRTVRLWASIFASKRNPVYSGGTVGAVVYERDGDVRIARRAGRFFFHNSLVMSRRGNNPETIEVKPPPPFAGSALYSHTPGAPATWTGGLRVDLPGADGIILTGSGFDAVLCRGRVNSCVYGNGSTSNG